MQVWMLLSFTSFRRSKENLEWDLTGTSEPCRSITATMTLSVMPPINSCKQVFWSTAEKCGESIFSLLMKKFFSLCSAEEKKHKNKNKTNIKLPGSVNRFILICAFSHSLVTRSHGGRTRAFSYLLFIYSLAVEEPFLSLCEEFSPFTWHSLVCHSLLSLPGSEAEGDTRAWQVFSCNGGEVLTPRNHSRWFGASLL